MRWPRGRTAERNRFEDTLKTFVESRRFSAEEERKGDFRRCADRPLTDPYFAAKAHPRDRRLPHPLTDALRPAQTCRRSRVYNHMDVQPASRETEPWNTDPFVFTKQGDRYFGRGTTDDKGPALSALWGIRAARERTCRSTSTCCGSSRKRSARRISSRASNSTSASWPPITSRLRHDLGLAPAPRRARGTARAAGRHALAADGETDQHSGVTGGAARNPLGEMMQLVSAMYDARTGKVKMKGFYDDVVLPSRRELEDFRNSGFSVEQFKKDHLFQSIRTEDPIDVMKRIWAMPTMEIHGLVGGYTGPGIKTVIPPRGEVKDLVPPRAESDPKKILKIVRNFIKAAQSRT
jgi:acetylornithine deacetylase/succinyl-diaminopimelate desuccinylase-like protein